MSISAIIKCTRPISVFATFFFSHFSSKLVIQLTATIWIGINYSLLGRFVDRKQIIRKLS